METIDDIRKQFGNPYAGDPTGPVRPINHAFRYPDASLRMGSLLVFLIGAAVMLIGIYTLVIAISSVGLGLVIVAVGMFWRANYMAHHRADFQRELMEEAGASCPSER